jgi:hypothetical protein
MSMSPDWQPSGDAPFDEVSSQAAYLAADLFGTMNYVARTLGDVAATLASAVASLDTLVARTVAGLTPQQRDEYDALLRNGATPLDALVSLGL